MDKELLANLVNVLFDWLAASIGSPLLVFVIERLRKFVLAKIDSLLINVRARGLSLSQEPGIAFATAPAALEPTVDTNDPVFARLASECDALAVA